MLEKNQNPNLQSEEQWRSIFRVGAFTTFLAILGTIFDILVGSTLGGDLSTTPITAIDKFNQFNDNWLIGLYNLDFLNAVTTVLMIPGYFALWAAHRRTNVSYVTLATIIYYIGAAVFITKNAALPMLDLSNKFFAATSIAQKNLLAAAGEAYLAGGGHGSPGALAGFVLLSTGSLMMAFGMLKGNLFSRRTAYVGILGSSLLLIYVLLVTFVPEIKNIAVSVAAPGGLLALAWTIMFTKKLFELGKEKNI
ncbi:MAG: hypothetical protein ACOYVD_17910 [Bacillota bacterium]